MVLITYHAKNLHEAGQILMQTFFKMNFLAQCLWKSGNNGHRLVHEEYKKIAKNQNPGGTAFP